MKSTNNNLNFKSNQYYNSFKDFYLSIKGIDAPWILTGSYRLLLEGASINPSDIDIITTQEGAFEILRRNSNSVEKSASYSQSGNMRSYFGRLRFNNISFDIVGDPEQWLDGKWIKLPEIKEGNTIFKTYKDLRFKVFSMKYEKMVSYLLNDLNKAEIIKRTENLKDQQTHQPFEE